MWWPPGGELEAKWEAGVPRLARMALCALAALTATPSSAALLIDYVWGPGWVEPNTDYTIHVDLSPRARLYSVEFQREDEWWYYFDTYGSQDYGWKFSCVSYGSGEKFCEDTYPYSDVPLVDIQTGPSGIRVIVHQAKIGPSPDGGVYLSGPDHYYHRLQVSVFGEEEDGPLAGQAQFRPIDGYLPIPEPATWALMIAGFCVAGAALRRRRAATSNRPLPSLGDGPVTREEVASAPADRRSIASTVWR